MSQTFCLLGLLNSRKSKGFRRTTARSTADCSSIFSEPFSKRETALSFFFLLDYASRSCSMTLQYFFCTHLLLNHVKCYLNSQNFPPSKTQREELFNDDVNRASVL